MPVFSILFILYTQDRNIYIVLYLEIFGFSLYIIGTFLGLILGLLIFCTSKRSVLPFYNTQLKAFSFIMSILWICAICEVMVDLLSLIGILLHLPVSFLGLTLLAWGNSAGDFCANPAIAKLGMRETAMTACFAGPLFNTLIGFGVSLIVACTSGSVTFDITTHMELIVAGSVLIFCTVLTIFLLLKNNGRIIVFHGKFQIAMYVVFLIVLYILV